MAEAVVRPYRPDDRDAVYDICLRTAAAGQDATARHRDPDVVGDVFAGPYLYLEPDYAFVLDHGGRTVGYVLGVPDTERFTAEWQAKWLPLVGPKHPDPAGPPADPDQEMAFLLHHPERMVLPALAGHPAHLHIDLLAGYRRQGFGRELIATLLDALRAAGVAKVHLGMVATNTRARAFYDRLGFTELAVPDAGMVTYLGRSTETVGLRR
jgi:ribosomal protein S18 acetylase RimI-like enzyme